MPMSQLGGLGDAAQQDRGRFQVPVRAHEFGMAEGGGEGEHVAAGAGAGRQVLEGPDGKGMSQRVRGRSAFFAGLSQAFLFRKLADVSGCVEPRINGEQRSPLGVIRGAGGDSERWVGV